MINRLRQLINKWCFEDDDVDLVECEEANLIVDKLEKALDKAKYDILELDKLYRQLNSLLNEEQKKLLDEIYNWHSAYETEQESQIYALQDEIKLLNKALDNACEKLSCDYGHCNCMKLKGFELPYDCHNKRHNDCKKCWKEYLLKEREEAEETE